MNDGDEPPVPAEPNGVVSDPAGQGLIEAAGGAQDDHVPDALVTYQPITNVTGTDLMDAVAEPEVAMSGSRALVTWNWGAGISTDGGRLFRYLNPYTSFPSIGGGFCCDQRVLHVPRLDLWLWEMQYVDGTIRLASAKDGQALEAGQFHYVDWTAQIAGLPPGYTFDQTKMATSDEYVFLSMNAYNGKAFATSVVIRAALADIVAGGVVSASCLRAKVPDSSDPPFGVIPTRGAGATMYLATHATDSTLALWSWRDSDEAPAYARIADVDASGKPIAYPGTLPYACPRDAVTESDWCHGVPINGGRPLSAWVANGHIGVTWNASSSPGQYGFPFVWVVVLDESKINACATGGCVLGHPHIFSQTFAIQYGAVMENAEGELGAVAIIGGGADYPTCTILAHDGNPADGTGWNYKRVGTSTADLYETGTGHYLGVSLDDDGAWVGACMSYEPGVLTKGDAMSVQVVRFGRNRNDPAG